MKKQKLLILLAVTMAVFALAAAPVMADLAADVTLDFNANDPLSGIDGTSWNSLATNQTRNITFGGDVSLVDVTTAATLITKAYRFTGGAGSKPGSWDTFNEQDDATWEIWIKPADSGDGNQVIFETGGSGDGMAIWYTVGTAGDNTGTVNIILDNGSTQSQVGVEIDTTDFRHIVMTFDKDSDGTDVDLIKMYVDGAFVADNSAQSPTTIGDWAGGNAAGVGTDNSMCNGAPTGKFTGDLSILRFWELKALTLIEVAGNYALLSGPSVNVIYPTNGEVVDISPAAITLQWENMDPNGSSGATDTYVDVWFGTDPNKATGETTGNYTKVVIADKDVESYLTDELAPGIYYWQVDSYLHGDPGVITDPCAVEGRLYMFTNDGPAVIEDMGPDMITWSGEGVDLIPDVNDDGGSELTYLWTADPADGVEFLPSDTDPNPTITVTKDFSKIQIVNPGFEDPVLGDGVYEYSLGNQGWGYFGNDGYQGPWNPTAADFPGEEAPGGENIGWANPGGVGIPGGFAQVLASTFTAETTYTLTVDVSHAVGGYPFSGYIVQLLAGGTPHDTENTGETGEVTGGTVIVEEAGGAASTTQGTFETITLVYEYDEENDANKVGLPLQVRLLSPGNVAADDYTEADFDNVMLIANPPPPPSPVPATVTVKLSVNDETNPGDTDTMTIDVYDTACIATRIGLDETKQGDLNEDCFVDILDMTEMALKWLNDSSVTMTTVDK